MVPVYVYADPDSSAENPYKFYTIIRARRPDSWGMGWNASVPVRASLPCLGVSDPLLMISYVFEQRCPGDARLPEFPPVFGPACSPIHKANQLDANVSFKRGRMRKVCASPPVLYTHSYSCTIAHECSWTATRR